jgi:hypothetical protein
MRLAPAFGSSGGCGVPSDPSRRWSDIMLFCNMPFSFCHAGLPENANKPCTRRHVWPSSTGHAAHDSSLQTTRHKAVRRCAPGPTRGGLGTPLIFPLRGGGDVEDGASQFGGRSSLVNDVLRCLPLPLAFAKWAIGARPVQGRALLPPVYEVYLQQGYG